ncbi:MAG TPA: CHAT domain-containing protein [Kofleriaceae bacterium]|jgi:hypothetical protein|nr:CHAT domain-containing protein [Kofleriaceae bacterium]
MPSPAILLAFANDWVDDKRHLRSLLDEGKVIDQALAPLVETGAIAVLPPIHNATVDDVIGAFRERRHRGRICMFHFGGHASGGGLLLEDEAGQPTAAHASGLAGYLGRQPGLVLVFLNGCCTEPQVRRLRAAGIRAVVATTRAIQDAVAAEFARTFYAELAARPMRDAFETAVQAIRVRWGDDPRAVTRDVGTPEDAGPPGWPWIIDCDPDHETWSPGAAAGRLRRTRRLRLVAALAVLVTASLAASAGARGTACRVAGLRAACAAIGIGGPAPAEQALWDEGVRQRTGDGLRRYLRSYPDGAHADAARARLAGCTIERVETRGSEKEVRFTLAVSQDRALPTEADARRDAVERGNLDAATTCAPQRRVADLLSAAAEPRGWRCEPRDGGVACGFDGEIVCRVRDRIRSERERCRDERE